MKYFWYMLRIKYRAAKYNAGFYTSYMGRDKASNNRDYCAGYDLGVYNLQLHAVKEGEITKQLHKAEAHMLVMQERIETWEEGYGWISDQIYRGEAIDGFVVADLDKSKNYKNGVQAAIEVESAIEKTRQATLELHRTEVHKLTRLVLVMQERIEKVKCAVKEHL